MKIDFTQMAEATRLVRSGQLSAATAAIQAALGAQADAGAAPAAASQTSTSGQAANDVIDVQARIVMPDDAHQDPSSPANPTATSDQPAHIEPLSDAPRKPSTGPGRFVAGSFSNGHDRRDYKLYIPDQAGHRPLPLVVMLHGCTQNPDDFAAGTAMNELADAQGFYVLYPAQSRQANPQGCWNWFKHSHQARGRGEPALLAAMAQHVMSDHRIDPRRVYVAGLSAGGAMAAILGDTYPEVFAAVGVHSGLAAGSALDLPSALSAMQGSSRTPSGAPSGVPTIVFHGDADATVHPRNGDQVIAASVGDASTVETGMVSAPGLRNATRAIYRDAAGNITAERWTVHGAPHAWSGGQPGGSYTDGRGPDASSQMLRFFLEHPHGDDPSIQPDVLRRA